jgi:DNA mismatch repair protein MutL
LTLDPEEVDVNVHPQKAEVRFQRGREVYEAVTRVLARSLGTSPWRGPAARSTSYWNARLPAGPVPAEQNAATEPPVYRPFAEPQPPLPAASAPRAQTEDGGPQAQGHEDTRLAPGYGPNRTAAVELRDGLFDTPGYARRDASTAFPSGLRALAQSRRLYIIAESERGLCLVDQHAADERIQYDRLRREFDARKVRQQRLLIPVRVELSEREAQLIEQRASDIAEAGIEVRLIGPTSAAIHAVPTLLGRAPPERLLRDWLDEISRAGERNFGDAVDTALATMACHGAIRAGDLLSLPECQALLDHLATIDAFAGHCPHGRPVIFEIGFDELARKVGR